jgi:hypothetical protein
MKKRILILLMLFMCMGIYAGSMEKKGDIVIVTDDFSKQVIVDPMNPNIVFYKNGLNEIFIKYNGIVIAIYGLGIEDVYNIIMNNKGETFKGTIRIKA